jgi:hypothetical protein
MRGGIQAMSREIPTSACEKSPLGLAVRPPSPEGRGGQGVRTALPTRGDSLSCAIATHRRSTPPPPRETAAHARTIGALVRKAEPFRC